MSSNPCSNTTTCPHGDCTGCKNGQPWCQDPRCQPNCATCSIQDTHDFNANMIMIVILICLMAILFIVWFTYGPQLFEPHSDHERANVIVPVELSNPETATTAWVG